MLVATRRVQHAPIPSAPIDANPTSRASTRLFCPTLFWVISTYLFCPSGQLATRNLNFDCYLCLPAPVDHHDRTDRIIIMYRLGRVRTLLGSSSPGFAVVRALATAPNLVLRQNPTALHISGASLPRSGLTLPFDWLRDSCQCPHCVHPSTRQKLVRTGDFIKPVPRSVVVVDEGSAVRIDWGGKGHDSVYAIDFLKRYADPSDQTRRVSHFDDVFAPRTWNVSDLPAESYVEYESLKTDPLPSFLQLLRYGLLIVRGLPHETTTRGPEVSVGVAQLANTIGIIRETLYGRFWDVVIHRDSTNIAYTNLNLDLHMDLLYMQHPPHIQLLHCIKNRVEGGASVFVDAIKAAHDLWDLDRDSFDVLASISIPFHYENAGHHLHCSHPTIQLAPPHLQPLDRRPSDPPHIAHINYSPPFQAPLPVTAPPELYSALQKYTQLLTRPAGRFEHTLAEGECAVFDNRRVLHARTAFWDKGDQNTESAEETNRWLKGCYVEVDDLLDRTRVLLAKRSSDLP
ncbi:gamma-butyrobetaine dioxygenase [Ceratobasidium sp. AG-Ba]|nr:gamma-butyrobetaine dioxygenase [Ceratobasidium sp. AG-Ba]